jgi:ankyrin repeat protein
MTGLHVAAYFGVREAVAELIRMKYDADSKDTYGRTPLSYAAANVHDAAV